MVSTGTKQVYDDEWTIWAGWCGRQSIDPATAGSWVVDRWIQERRESGASNGTCRIAAAAISARRPGV